ncbi:MAG: alpha/beta hydrolase [Deltaproteobacteria bacterium]|nr:alpha/beta hydrolase [Deltaproteobacteria bacterium]
MKAALSDKHPQTAIIPLRDGRNIGAALYGTTSFRSPILYFHGFPGSRLEISIADSVARELDITLIALDRPGVGNSTPCKGRALTDWPNDVEQAALHFNLESFDLLAVSGGAPYALACAASRLAPKLKGVTIVSGLSPIGWRESRLGMAAPYRLLFFLARNIRPAARAVLYAAACVTALYPKLWQEFLKLSLSEADRRVLSDAKASLMLARNLKEAQKHGVSPLLQDFSLLTSSWGFEPGSIAAPVHFWHGCSDRMLPHKGAEKLRSLICGAQLTLLKGEGHFMAIERHREILLSIVQRP